MKKFLVILMIVAGFFLNPVKIKAQVEAAQFPVFEAEIIEVIEQGEKEVAGQVAPYQLLKLNLIQTNDQITSYQLEHGGFPTAFLQEYQAGDQVFVNFYQPLSELSQAEIIDNTQANITGYATYHSLGLIAFLFVVVVIIATGAKGIKSLLSLVLSFVVIFKIVLPLLLANVDPVLVISVMAVFIIPLTFYLSHGFNRKTHVAVLTTTLCLIFASLLAITLTNVTHLTGFASEEAGFIAIEQQGQINIRGLLLAGIILGLLGTLDDVSVTQAGLVFSLKKNNNKLGFKKLYQQAMLVGQDHITSMVNTLVFVYAGASLPLLLLFINNPHPLSYVLSQEIVVEEIVRAVVTSVGLILAAPLTTLVASLVADWKQVKQQLQVK